MAPDGTSSSGVDQNLARNDVMAETIRIVSTSMLGLSVGCAQCHEHRYDPITQADYYRMRAIFEPAYDWQKWRSPQERLISMWSAETRTTAAAVDAELSELSNQRTAALDKIVAETLNVSWPNFHPACSLWPELHVKPKPPNGRPNRNS